MIALRNQLRRSSSWVFALALIFLPPLSRTAFAQSAPSFVFEVQKNGGSWSVASSSWSTDYNNDTGSLARRSGVSGSVTSTSLTANTYSDQDGSATMIGVQSTITAVHAIKVWVKGPASVVLGAGTTASVLGSGYGSDTRSALYYGIPFTPTNISVTLPAGTSTDSTSDGSSNTKAPTLTCGATGGRTFTEYPGVTYYPVWDGTIGSSTMTQATFNGHVRAEGTTVLSGTIGTDAPVANADGPYVSSVLNNNPALNSSVSFTNLSYDPDNQQGTTALAGICQAVWEVTYPDATVSTFSSTSNPGYLNSLTVTANRSGVYSVKLTLTDNEGTTADTTKTFVVNPQDPKPGSTGPSCMTGGDGTFTAGADAGTGNFSIGAFNSVATRGLALQSNIYINSQSHDLARTTALGNASFTYGMEVRQMPVRTSTGTYASHWFVVDGDGAEHDFGVASSAPAAGDGVFSSLTQVTGGYLLSGAGAPENVNSAGNYEYEFDTNGILQQITDPQGNVQTLTYDTNGDLIQVDDSSSAKILEFEYDTPHYIARIVQNGGAAVTHLTYGSGKLTGIAVKDSGGTTIRSLAVTYNGNGVPQTVTRDGDSTTTLTVTYTDAGYGVYLANVAWSGGATNYVYGKIPGSGASYRTAQTTSKGGVFYYDYDSKLDLAAVTFPAVSGATATVKYTYTFDSDHLLTNFSNGTVSYTLTYAANGKLTHVQDSASNYRQYTYSGADLTKIEDNIGTLVQLGYTDTNQPHVATTITDAGSHTWTRALNAYGQVTGVTPPTSSPTGVTQYTYDETSSSPTFGYLLSITNGAGDVKTIDTYSLLGDITSATTYPNGGTTNTENFSYDATQRPTGETHPDTTFTDYQYTGNNLTQSTDEAGTQTTYGYCATCGRMTEMHEPLSRSLYWTLDGDHDLTQFTDARSNNTAYTLGTASELKQMTLADSTSMVYKYDNYGRMNKITRWGATGNVGTISYNSANRPSGINYGATGVASANRTFTYYSDGTINTHSGDSDYPLNATYTYTAERLIASVSYNYSSRGLSNTQKLEYTYNPDQTRASMVWKSNTTTIASWAYSYDAAGRLSAVTNSFGESVSYTYDGEGKITTQTNGNGTTVNYTFNEDRDWPTIIDHKLSGTSFAKYTLTYDSGSDTVGNLTGVTELSGDTMAYGYDALYRLTSETRTGSNSYSKTYGYDLEGNITTLNGSAFASYDSGNKISSITGGSASYSNTDLFTISGTGIPSTGTFNFGVDGNLTQQRLNGTNSYSYRIDGLERRVFAPYSGGNRFYVFDGDKVVGELLGNTAKFAYTWGADGLASERVMASNKSLYYHFGPQGETRYLTGSTGTVADSYLYSAYGATITTTGSDPNFHMYGGKYGYYTDGPNGIILAGVRWYHPTLMRWLSRDPIGYEGGTNLYDYVHGNPVKFIDPSGLSPDELEGSIMLRDFEKLRRLQESGAVESDLIQPSDLLVPPVLKLLKVRILVGSVEEATQVGGRLLASEVGAVGGKCGVFKGAAQRRNLEGLVRHLKKQLVGRQREVFKQELEDKLGAQFNSSFKVREIFKWIKENIKP